MAVTTYGGTVGASNKLGQLTFALHGSYDREAYPDIALFGAGSTALSADDYNDYGLKLQTSYRLSEALSPWVEFGYDVRLYDGATDALGYLRDSTGYAGKAGVTLDISKVLTGEASLGYGERKYQDPRLERAAAPLVDASLIWSPTALTTVTLKASTRAQRHGAGRRLGRPQPHLFDRYRARFHPRRDLGPHRNLRD